MRTVRNSSPSARAGTCLGGGPGPRGKGVPGPRGKGVPGPRGKGVPGPRVCVPGPGEYLVLGGTWFKGEGCTWSKGGYLVLWGYLVPGGGVYLVQGCVYLVLGGVPGPGGGNCPGRPAQVLPPVNRMTDRQV